MKTSKKIVLAAAALLIIFSTASAYTFGSKHRGEKCGGMDRDVLHHMNLTNELQTKLEELKTELLGEHE
ncbi:hypothetical protein L3Q72_22550 [Vibrio sp. JC009]|uniref:hypothetical protein n=1 Tax=Vibrio sp. JC009 TaxID=2912314 RepID=UPI0023B05C5A|nr:hypothetical protein [Vibrio sp. JC009]WED24014.1 hypothetical protein L3Q72_22550 [Vibrio sp. JC009]